MARKKLFISTFLSALLVKLGFKILSFSAFQKLYKVLFYKTGKGHHREMSDNVLWALNVVCRLLPINLTCLERALVAKIMLRPDNGFKLHVGVRPSANPKLQAHAWIESQGKTIDLTDHTVGDDYQTLWVWEP